MQESRQGYKLQTRSLWKRRYWIPEPPVKSGMQAPTSVSPFQNPHIRYFPRVWEISKVLPGGLGCLLLGMQPPPKFLFPYPHRTPPTLSQPPPPPNPHPHLNLSSICLRAALHFCPLAEVLLLPQHYCDWDYSTAPATPSTPST